MWKMLSDASASAAAAVGASPTPPARAAPGTVGSTSSSTAAAAAAANGKGWGAGWTAASLTERLYEAAEATAELAGVKADVIADPMKALEKHKNKAAGARKDALEERCEAQRAELVARNAALAAEADRCDALVEEAGARAQRELEDWDKLRGALERTLPAVLVAVGASHAAVGELEGGLQQVEELLLAAQLAKLEAGAAAAEAEAVAEHALDVLEERHNAETRRRRAIGELNEESEWVCWQCKLALTTQADDPNADLLGVRIYESTKDGSKRLDAPQEGCSDERDPGDGVGRFRKDLVSLRKSQVRNEKWTATVATSAAFFSQASSRLSGAYGSAAAGAAAAVPSLTGAAGAAAEAAGAAAEAAAGAGERARANVQSAREGAMGLAARVGLVEEGDDGPPAEWVDRRNQRAAQLFSLFDFDGDGALSSEEFGHYLRGIGFWGSSPYTEREWAAQWPTECRVLGAAPEVGVRKEHFITLYGEFRKDQLRSDFAKAFEESEKVEREGSEGYSSDTARSTGRASAGDSLYDSDDDNAMMEDPFAVRIDASIGAGRNSTSPPKAGAAAPPPWDAVASGSSPGNSGENLDPDQVAGFLGGLDALLADDPAAPPKPGAGVGASPYDDSDGYGIEDESDWVCFSSGHRLYFWNDETDERRLEPPDCAIREVEDVAAADDEELQAEFEADWERLQQSPTKSIVESDDEGEEESLTEEERQLLAETASPAPSPPASPARAIGKGESGEGEEEKQQVVVENWGCEFCAKFRIPKSVKNSFDDVCKHEEDCFSNPKTVALQQAEARRNRNRGGSSEV